LSLPAAIGARTPAAKSGPSRRRVPASISYRITEQDTPLGGRRLILKIEPAAISAGSSACTRDTGTINPENTDGQNVGRTRLFAA
jgi:hypothetical protein